MTPYERSPHRLVKVDEELAPILRTKPDRGTASDEVRAWDALERRLKQPRRLWLWPWTVAVAAGAVGAALWFDLPALQNPGPEPTLTAETLPAVAPVALPVGRSELPDGSTARLAIGGVAKVTVSNEHETRVALERGSVDIEAVSQGAKQAFVVEAAGHEFRVVGTRFTVSTASGKPCLRVAEGTVEVWREQRRLASVPAGNEWPEPERPKTDHPTPRPSQQVPSAARETTRDCLQLIRAGQTRDAERCLERHAGGGDLDAELALYELARLRQNVRGNSSGAIAALRNYQRQFPSGAFRSEVQLTLIELLNASGRSAEAAAEADAALNASVAPERAGELHLIVAQHRVNRGDCAGAEPHLSAARGISSSRIAALRNRCVPRSQEPNDSTPPVGSASFDYP